MCVTEKLCVDLKTLCTQITWSLNSISCELSETPSYLSENGKPKQRLTYPNTFFESTAKVKQEPCSAAPSKLKVLNIPSLQGWTAKSVLLEVGPTQAPWVIFSFSAVLVSCSTCPRSHLHEVPGSHCLLEMHIISSLADSFSSIPFLMSSIDV